MTPTEFKAWFRGLQAGLDLAARGGRDVDVDKLMWDLVKEQIDDLQEHFEIPARMPQSPFSSPSVPKWWDTVTCKDTGGYSPNPGVGICSGALSPSVQGCSLSSDVSAPGGTGGGPIA